MRTIAATLRTAALRLPVLVAGAALLLTAGCGPNPERREREYMPDMYRNPAVKPQEEYSFFADGSGMRVPPEGSVPRGFEPYPFGAAEREKARELENPLGVSEETFRRGRKYYNIHCRPCHGVVGSGDGLATQAHRDQGFPIPASLYSETIITEWADGEIFHVITKGQGQMPALASRIKPEDRWAIVHYVRALGVAANPTEEDLEAVGRLGWDARERDDPYRTLGPADRLYLGTMRRPGLDD